MPITSLYLQHVLAIHSRGQSESHCVPTSTFLFGRAGLCRSWIGRENIPDIHFNKCASSRGPHGGSWRRPYFVAEGIMRRASRDVSKSAIDASNPSGVICLDEMSDGRHNAAHTGRDREKRAKCARVSLWRRRADRPSLSCGCSPRLAWIRISTYRP